VLGAEVPKKLSVKFSSRGEMCLAQASRNVLRARGAVSNALCFGE
jgi:hypothetical protein